MKPASGPSLAHLNIFCFEKKGGGMNWEIGIDMYTLMCIKWMTNNLLYKKINKIQKLKKRKTKNKQKTNKQIKKRARE